jgi:hypothetical protein
MIVTVEEKAISSFVKNCGHGLMIAYMWKFAFFIIINVRQGK